MKELTSQEMVEIDGGLSWGCGIAWASYGTALLALGLASGGALTVAGVAYILSIGGVICGCTDLC